MPMPLSSGVLTALSAAVAQGWGDKDIGELARFFREQLTSPLYGPAALASIARQGASAGVMREVISNGTPRMPGFKHNFQPPQIDAIVAYLKTIPAPAP